MSIISAKSTLEGGMVIATFGDGTEVHIPVGSTGDFPDQLQAWVDGSGVIAPADPAPAKPSGADQAETSIRSGKALLAIGRIATGDDALTEDALVALARAKLP